MFTFQTTSYSPSGDNVQCHACLLSDNVLLHKDINLKVTISIVGNNRMLHLHCNAACFVEFFLLVLNNLQTYNVVIERVNE